MYNLYCCELKKIKKSTYFYVLLLIALIMPALLSLLVNNNAALMAERGTPESALGYYAFKTAISDSGPSILLGSILAGLLICSDFENRTIQAAAAAGHSRFSILLGNMAAYITVLPLLIFPYPLVTLLATCILNGFGPALTGDIIISMIIMLFLKVILDSAFLCLCIPICFLIKRPGISMITSIAVLTGFLETTASLQTNHRIWAFLYRWIPHGQLKKIVSLPEPGTQILSAAVSAVCLTLICFAGAYILFRNTELK